MTRNDGDKAIKKIFETGNIPDAIFCANDTTALAVTIFLKNKKIKIPEDIAIVGFSNEPFSELVTPAISTIKQPGFSMGQKAVKLIIDQINSKEPATVFETITMPTELIVRDSSQK